MKKIHEVCKTIALRYSQNKAKRDPQLIWHAKQSTDSEVFSCRYAGGEIKVDAESAQAAVYGMSQLTIGAPSGHYAEFLGNWNPRFPLRPLWIGCDAELIIAPGISLTLPAFLMRQQENNLDLFCQRVLELGYNSILLGSRDSSLANLSEEFILDLETLCGIFHDYALKVILKPNLSFESSLGKCPLNPQYADATQKHLRTFIQRVPNVNYLFWEGGFLHPDCIRHPLAHDATQAELVQAEVTMVEASLPKSTGLIYYVPAPDASIAKQQAAWMSPLSDQMGPRTILAFSATSGDPYADHLSPHPFWETLRRSPDVSATPLMPIVNVGAVRQGEGLWPILTFDMVDNYFSRCRRHSFAGVISLVNQLPNRGSFLDCNLWVSSQVLWKERPAFLMAETWFSSQRPDLNFHAMADALRAIRQFAIELSLLRSFQNEKHRDILSNEECRTMATSLLARLKHLEHIFEKEEKKRTKKTERPTFFDYFTFFARDARRMISHFLQRFNVSSLQLREQDDMHDGFWTKATNINTKPILLENPQKGTPGSRMEMIYLESRLQLLAQKY